MDNRVTKLLDGDKVLVDRSSARRYVGIGKVNLLVEYDSVLDTIMDGIWKLVETIRGFGEPSLVNIIQRFIFDDIS